MAAPTYAVGQAPWEKSPAGGFPVGQEPWKTTPAPAPNEDPLDSTAHGLGSFFGGDKIGDSLGTIFVAAHELMRGRPDIAHNILKTAPSVPQLIGDYVKSATNAVTAGVGAGKTILGTAAKFAALSGTGSAADDLAHDASLEKITRDFLTSAGIGGAVGGTFKLLEKGAAKIGPSALSFTSGVPKQSIERAAANPEAAKEGLKMSLDEIHTKATDALQGLYNDLGREFESGLKEVTSTTGQTKNGVAYNPQGFIKSASAMRTRLTEYSRDFAREFRLGTKASPEGLVINFDKSPITKPGEQRAVQEAFKTISTWDDFSAKGLQDLAERVSSLRNFENGAKTESSAIVSKIYNKITGAGGQSDHGLISKYYPDLYKLRSSYASNRDVLDEIQNVLNATSEKPTQIQSAVSRLDKLYAENRETYLNVIKNLSDRSGTDFLSLIAGSDFQKILPGFIRGLGGGGAVGVGASLVNPWLIMLAPLFSPRAVGGIVRNSKSLGKAAEAGARAASVAGGEVINDD